jgi:DNA-binding transcriptional LysR family regulator
LDRRQLIAFMLLAEELSFSRAAARLGLTQPALSLAIARLEDDLGVTLFERTKRRVELTQPGRVFLAETELTLRQMDLARAMVHKAAKGKIGRITIGFVEAAPFNVLPGIVALLRKVLPEIELVLREMVTSEQVDALEARRIDIGLMRPMFAYGRFDTAYLYKEPYVVAMATDSPLSKQASIRYDDLRNEALITTPLPKRRYLESKFKVITNAQGLSLPIVHEIHQIHAVIGLVAGGLGVAFVPESASVIAQPGVCYRPFDETNAPSSELVAAWRKEEPSAVVQHVAKLLTDLVNPAARERRCKGAAFSP